MNGDVMTGALTTDPMAARKGDYAILRGTLMVSENYDLQFSAGTLSVLAR
ncbi:hypothetical protein [Croceicoccus sp. YJ47]|nr:hypothetical protein [Croceicoccus sp. YJ47]QQN74294.1 hypothetical protein JD971_00295 [Croceicoccus sp. YJ47]